MKTGLVTESSLRLFNSTLSPRESLYLYFRCNKSKILACGGTSKQQRVEGGERNRKEKLDF